MSDEAGEMGSMVRLGKCSPESPILLNEGT